MDSIKICATPVQGCYKAKKDCCTKPVQQSLVRPGGFEPLAFRVGAERSIQLSYDRKCCTPLVGTTQYNTSACKMQTKIVSLSGSAARCGISRR